MFRAVMNWTGTDRVDGRSYHIYLKDDETGLCGGYHTYEMQESVLEIAVFISKAMDNWNWHEPNGRDYAYCIPLGFIETAHSMISMK